VGGVSITAGHNPEPWNALKFVRGDGLYLNATQADELLDIFHQAEFAKADWRGIKVRSKSGTPSRRTSKRWPPPSTSSVCARAA
jgi:phosphomannomutase